MLEEVRASRLVIEEQINRIRELEIIVENMRAASVEPLLPAFPLDWGLSRSEEILLLALRGKGLVSKDQIMAALYSDLRAAPDKKIIDIMTCRLRKKIAKHGLTIETVWGRGVRLIDTKMPDAAVS